MVRYLDHIHLLSAPPTIAHFPATAPGGYDSSWPTDWSVLRLASFPQMQPSAGHSHLGV